MSESVLKKLAGAFPEKVKSTYQNEGGNWVALVEPEALVEVAKWLRDEPSMDFDMLRDVVSLDFQGYTARPVATRYALAYPIYSIGKKHEIVLRVELDGEEPTVPSLTPVWKAANWGEREAWDMMGIRFTGHPDLRRVLLYEEFEGHPLRKDYDKRKSQPRMDLLKPERDALAEYKKWDREYDGQTKSTAS
ncbi:MAG: NADH-quinone oxidoreductase subunit C [Myxococcales bacterium]|nr:NADH-quinone oxidoreductase subunit C [Myxococcales bacterium]